MELHLSNGLKTTPAPAIEVEQLTRRFGSVTALDGVTLSVGRGEFFSLLGPSGCGKTTLLRIIAGLDVADAGRVRIGGVEANDIPAHRRPVNTVFQSYALFPHMTIRDNVAFGLRMKRLPEAQVQQRVDAILKLVEIAPLSERKPAQISGGQKQRVALARAIVNEPEVLLLDEPLGALDLKLRKQLQLELRNLQRRLGITFLYVTHDQDEALVLSDRIAVFREGRMEQLDTPANLYEKPRTRFVSQFLGSCSLLEGTVKASDAQGACVSTPVGLLQTNSPASAGSKVTLAIRPEKVRIVESGAAKGTGENRFGTRVEDLVYVGSGTHFQLRSGDQLILAERLNAGGDHPGLRVGDPVQVELPPGALVLLED